ncbi:MAG: PKD domain-containing protein [Chloroflexi bacterium]|nr:PKD domain-containing protein [Chloroflexota bacterium]
MNTTKLKWLVPFLGIVLLLGGIASLRSGAGALASPGPVSLSILPAARDMMMNSTAEWQIQVAAGVGESVMGVDAFVTFDPAVFQVVGTITDGTTSFSVPYKDFNNSVGIITYSAITVTGYVTNSTFTLARFALSAVATATGSSISFSSTGLNTTRVADKDGNLYPALTLNGATANSRAIDAAFACPSAVVNTPASLTDQSLIASGGAITQWLWGFGDGMSALLTTSGSTTHVYTQTGVYTVSLTVTGTVSSVTYSDSEVKTSCATIRSAEVAAPTPPLTTIKGSVYEDNNGNGVMDAGEAGISNVAVRVTSDGWTKDTLSGLNGAYEVCCLTPATFKVSITVPGGWTNTTPTLVAVTVSGNPPTVVVDFGLARPAAATPAPAPPAPTPTPVVVPTPTPVVPGVPRTGTGGLDSPGATGLWIVIALALLAAVGWAGSAFGGARRRS